MRVGSDSEDDEEDVEERIHARERVSRRRGPEIGGVEVKESPKNKEEGGVSVSSVSTVRPFPALLIAQDLSDDEEDEGNHVDEFSVADEELDRGARKSQRVEHEEAERNDEEGDLPRHVRFSDGASRRPKNNNNNDDDDDDDDERQREESDESDQENAEETSEVVLEVASVSSSSSREKIRQWPSRSELFPDLDGDFSHSSSRPSGFWDPSSFRSLEPVSVPLPAAAKQEKEEEGDAEVDLTEFLVSLRMQQVAQQDRSQVCESFEAQIRQQVKQILGTAVEGPLNLFLKQQQDPTDEDTNELEEEEDEEDGDED